LIILSGWFRFSKENEDFIDQAKNFCALPLASSALPFT
jgi:hypothetical protein